MKPRYRGVSHEWGAYFAAIAGLILIIQAPGTRAAIAAGIYSLSLVVLLGISALYHRPTWQPGPRALMRRLDHSAIFILIAGTYTPVCLLVLGDDGGAFQLRLIWAGAGLGILQSVFWPKAPKPLVALFCVGLGWVAIGKWATLVMLLSPWALACFGIGGVLYTFGAIFYAARRPDPWPLVFGYHEIFHVLVLAASVLHFTAVTQIVLAFA